MHRELYRSGRAGWLLPAVLGANDGIVSTASLVIGVAAAAASRNAVLLAGVEGVALADGRLADLAPTLLELMGLPQPPEMTGTPLLRPPGRLQPNRTSL